MYIWPYAKKKTRMDMEVMVIYLQPLLSTKKMSVGINMSRPNINSLFNFLIDFPLLFVGELRLNIDLGSFLEPIWISCKLFFFDPGLLGFPRIKGLVVVTCRLSLVGGVVDDTCKVSLVIRTSKLPTPSVVCYSKLARTIVIGSKMV